MPDPTSHAAPPDLRALRRRCLARLRALSVPVPFDLQPFCAALAADRDRPLLLVPFFAKRPKDRDATTGAWHASIAADYIFYEPETSPLHQAHIILHELGHLLCDHPPRAVAAATLQTAQFSHIRLDQVAGALRQGAYSTTEECEAEIFASLLLERVALRHTAPSTRPSADPDGALHHLAAVLETGGRSSA